MNQAFVFRPEPFQEAFETGFASGELAGLDLGELEWEAEVARGSPDYVRWVQSGLNKILGLRLTVDGVAGAQTRSAIRAFQRKYGLAIDGVVGPQTERTLVTSGAGDPPGVGAPSYLPPSQSVRPSAATPTTALSFIAIRSGVKLTPETEKAVRALDGHFRRANLQVTLTSGYRSPEDQLRIIRDQAIKRGINRQYPSIETATVDNVESWLGAWDELLNRHGYIVNPPRDASSRITGKRYQPSPHTRGVAFDLSGSDLDRIAAVVRDYCRQGGPISQILIERTNNAVHVGVGPVREC